jgi:hypothetical protein
LDFERGRQMTALRISITAVWLIALMAWPPLFADETPEALIESAYQLVRKVYSGPAAASQYDPLDEPNSRKFFTKRVLDSLTEARKKDEMALDWDPFVAGQDAELSDIKIKRLFGTACTARIEAVFLNFGKPTRIHFDVVRTNVGWRISDIRGPEYVLTQIGRKRPLPPERGDC